MCGNLLEELLCIRSVQIWMMTLFMQSMRQTICSSWTEIFGNKFHPHHSSLMLRPSIKMKSLDVLQPEQSDMDEWCKNPWLIFWKNIGLIFILEFEFRTIMKIVTVYFGFLWWLSLIIQMKFNKCLFHFSSIKLGFSYPEAQPRSWAVTSFCVYRIY